MTYQIDEFDYFLLIKFMIIWSLSYIDIQNLSITLIYDIRIWILYFCFFLLMKQRKLLSVITILFINKNWLIPCCLEYPFNGIFKFILFIGNNAWNFIDVFQYFIDKIV